MTLVFQTLTADVCAAVQATALVSWQSTYHAIFDATTIHNFITTNYAVDRLQALVVPATNAEIFLKPSSRMSR